MSTGTSRTSSFNLSAADPDTVSGSEHSEKWVPFTVSVFGFFKKLLKYLVRNVCFSWRLFHENIWSKTTVK